MKCIKAIRATKDVELGEIKRVDDKTASNMVGSYWQYVAKSEWKALTRKPKQTEQPIKENEDNKEKKPYKKGQKNKKS
jgi:hypothetical protein